MNLERFWIKSWDEGVTDLDSNLWDKSYIHAIRPTFEQCSQKMACEFMGVEISFGELDRYSNQFAHMLIENGLKKGDKIGLSLVNVPQYLIALLGAMKVGCVVTGVSFLLSEEQLIYQLDDVEAKGLVTLDAVFEKRLVNIASMLPKLELIVYTNVGDFLPKIKQVLGKLIGKIPKGKISPLEGKTILKFMDVINNSKYSTDYPDIPLTANDLAFILYTGGTTGPPKGAMLTNKNILSDILLVMNWLNWETGKGIALSGFPFFHIAGLFFAMNCMYLGWSQLLIPNPRDTNQICKSMEKYKPTVLVNVPSLYQMLIKNPKFKTLDHSKLECCISSASPFPVESQKEFESIVGKEKILEVYGMTETGPLTTMNPFKNKKKLGSVGLPLMNTYIKLVDPDTGEQVEIGEPGEICVKGPQVMPGYWKRSEETKRVFDDEGYMHTGDVAVFDEEGYLRIVDRTKDMMIVSGYKVFSSKLEDILSQHPAIDMVATIGISNPGRPGSELVKAYITISSDFNFDGDTEALKNDITSWAKTKVSPYEVPKIIEIREELPLTIVGKIDKKVLRNEISRT